MNLTKFWCGLLLPFVILLSLATAASEDWHVEFPAFKIAGNLYYVGTADLAAYLIATPQGNILINTNFPQDLPLLRKSIGQLGFNYRDTKIILLSHAHRDHDAAAGIIKQETGAQLMVMEADVSKVTSNTREQPGAKVDHVLHDGDKVELGGTTLTAHLTPGHTEGCTTWTMRVDEGNRTLLAVIIGSVNVNPTYVLVGNKSYPNIAEDYTRAFAALKKLPADIFLAAHGSAFGIKGKHAILRDGIANPFVDAAGFQSYVVKKEAQFKEELEWQQLHPGSPSGKKRGDEEG